MVLPLWRSLYSLNLMLPKEDRKAMLLRIYNEDTPLMDHSKDRFNKRPSPTAESLVSGRASDTESQEAAAAEEQERVAVTMAREETSFHSDKDDEVDGGVAIEPPSKGAD